MWGNTATLEDLSADAVDVLTAIVGGRLAWTPVADLGNEAAVDGLITGGLVIRWTTRVIDVATLTPFGAWLMEVELVERVRRKGEDLEEEPMWAKRPAPPRQLRLPRHAHEIRYPWMETFPDPLPGPEYLIDDESGKPVELFAKLFDGEWIGGVRIVIDKRMRAKGKKGKGTRLKAG